MMVVIMMCCAARFPSPEERGSKVRDLVQRAIVSGAIQSSADTYVAASSSNLTLTPSRAGRGTSRNFLFDFANSRFVLPYPIQRQVAIRLAITTGSGLRR